MNPAGRTMDLVLTQTLKEMDTVGGKEGRCVGLTALSSSCADCLEILGTSTFSSPKDLA
jgi:hypothetical protein